MKKKDQEIENLIYGELNAEKPPESVLDAAKRQMNENIAMPQSQASSRKVKGENIKGGAVGTAGIAVAKRRAIVLFGAFAAVIIAVCICLAFIFRGQESIAYDDFTGERITSIESYDESLLSLSYDVKSSILYYGSDGSPVYIAETYGGDTEIELYVLLDGTQTNLQVLSKFSNLSHSESIGGVFVEYGEADGGFAAKFTCGGCGYYIYAEVETCGQILYYVQELLN